MSKQGNHTHEDRASDAGSTTPPKRPFVPFYKDLFDWMLIAPLTHTELLVSLAIVRWTIGHYHQDDGAAISIDDIVRVTGLSRTAVADALKSLKAHGVLRCERPRTGRTKTQRAIEHEDSAKWNDKAPGKPRPKRRAEAAVFIKNASAVYGPDGTQDSVVYGPDGTCSAVQTVHNSGLCTVQAAHSEDSSQKTELRELSSEDTTPPTLAALPLEAGAADQHEVPDSGIADLSEKLRTSLREYEERRDAERSAEILL